MDLIKACLKTKFDGPKIETVKKEKKTITENTNLDDKCCDACINLTFPFTTCGIDGEIVQPYNVCNLFQSVYI